MKSPTYYIKLAYLLGKCAANLDAAKALFKERSGALARMAGPKGMGRRMAMQQYWPAEMQQAGRSFVTRPIAGVGAPPAGYGLPRRSEDIRKRIQQLQGQATARQWGAVEPNATLPGVFQPKGTNWMSKDQFGKAMVGK